MSAVPDLRGELLRLRELRPADLDAFCAIHTSTVLTRFLGVERHSQEQAANSFQRSLTQRDETRRRRYTMAITEPDDGPMHGIIGLLLEDYGSNAMITGLVIRPGTPVAGQGAQAGRLLMAYGFGVLGLHRIWAGHRSDHHRMREVMLEAGFHPEATLRELFHTGGLWHDVTTYAALEHDWRRGASAVEKAIFVSAPAAAPAPRTSGRSAQPELANR